MYSMGLFLGLPQDGTPSMLKQLTNNGSMSLAQLESHHPMKDVKILKYIMPRVSVPLVYLKTFFCGNPMFLSKITLLPWPIRH